eukprot:3044340-Pleurochrysis_carterae.AAC.1
MAAGTLPRTGASMVFLPFDVSEWCECCPPRALSRWILRALERSLILAKGCARSLPRICGLWMMAPPQLGGLISRDRQ